MAQGKATPFRAIVVMGVSGSGKTTIGSLLAKRLEFEFRDGDGFHPPANVEKMSRGLALDDADRLPWLTAIAAWIDELRERDGRGIVACSALKRRYRDILIGGRNDVRLVYLSGDQPTIAARLGTRRDHFMPASLLASQFAALEEPAADESPVTVGIEGTPDEIVARIVATL